MVFMVWERGPPVTQLVKKCKPGHRRGERHPRAKNSDHEVTLAAELRRQGMSYRQIAAKFEVHERTVRDWCSGRLRGGNFSTWG